MSSPTRPAELCQTGGGLAAVYPACCDVSDVRGAWRRSTRPAALFPAAGGPGGGLPGLQHCARRGGLAAVYPACSAVPGGGGSWRRSTRPAALCPAGVPGGATALCPT